MTPELERARANAIWGGAFAALIVVLSLNINEDSPSSFAIKLSLSWMALCLLYVLASESPKVVMFGAVIVASGLSYASFSTPAERRFSLQTYQLNVQVPLQAGVVTRLWAETRGSDSEAQIIEQSTTPTHREVVALVNVPSARVGDDWVMRVATNSHAEAVSYSWTPSLGVAVPLRKPDVPSSECRWIISGDTAAIDELPAGSSVSWALLSLVATAKKFSVTGSVTIYRRGGALEVSLSGLWSFVIGEDDICRIKKRYATLGRGRHGVSVGVAHRFELQVDNRAADSVLTLLVDGMEVLVRSSPGVSRSLPWRIALAAYGCGMSVSEIRVVS